MTHTGKVGLVLWFVWFVAYALLAGCGRSTSPSAHLGSVPPEPNGTGTGTGTGQSAREGGSASAPAATVAAPRPSLSPLSADSELVAMPVDGYKDAVVSLPLGTTEKRPVVVALHGNFDRPEWQCEVWRGIVGASAFVLCPRGVPRRDAPKNLDRWEYAGGKSATAELEAGLAALRERYADYVAEGAVVFTGFSLGAILGTRIVQGNPKLFSRVVLTEGGSSGWTPATARAFVERGGERLLIACGQSACANSARALAPRLEKAGLQVRVAFERNAGHTYDGPVAQSIRGNWAWLVEGDPHWPAQAASEATDGPSPR